MNEKEEFTFLLKEVWKKLDTLKSKMFFTEECILKEEEILNCIDYEKLYGQYEKYGMWDDIINEVATEIDNNSFFYKGYCAVCGNDVNFMYRGYRTREELIGNGNGSGIHMFREGFFCPQCKCNARLRFMVHKIRKEYERGMKVYLYERVTSAYEAISKFIPEDDLIGSEYFGNTYKSGEYVNGILHQDAAKLSFADNSFDLMLSMDVFEHTYYYKEVFKEVYRVLKPGGKMFLTIPMRPNCDRTIERARIVDGEIINIMEPLMHGDPLNPKEGVLEFIQYGWDVIPFMKNIGFSEVRMRTYYSVNDAYLGRIPFYFELIK